MGIHLGYYTPLVGFARSARRSPPALADFPLMKEFESTGQFWLPRNASQPLWGKLHYLPGNVTSVTLDGKITGTDHSRTLDIPELHGRLFNGTPCVIKAAWGNTESFIGRGKGYSALF